MDPFDEVPVDEEIEDRQADGGRQRGAVPRMPQVELARPAIDRVVHVLPAEHPAERRVSGAEALADGHDVGLDRQLMGGEPRPGASHPGDHFVEADQEAVLRAPLGQPAPERFRRRVGGQRRCAHGLAEERRDRLRPGLVEESVELVAARLRPSGRTATSMARGAGGARGTGRTAPAACDGRSGRASPSWNRGRPAPGRSPASGRHRRARRGRAARAAAPSRWPRSHPRRTGPAPSPGPRSPAGGRRAAPAARS